MLASSLLVSFVLSFTSVTITEPSDGEVYDGDWLTVRAIVENENEIPDFVHYSLNGESVIQIPRLNTDWYTYMGNDCHTGFSESPAPVESTVLWSVPITGDTHEFCSPVVVNGVVYFVSDQQSTAYALDGATGEILWQYDVINHVDDAVTIYDGKTYIAADSAWCLNAVTGERIWAFKPAPYLKMNGTPALGGGVAYFSFAPNSNSLEVHALDAQSGQSIWFTEIPSYSTGCLTLHDNRIYVPTYNGSLYALNTNDGSVIWENSDSPSGYWDSSPVLVDDVIYICGFDGIARGIDCETGITIWSEEITAGVWYIAATPAYAYGNLYFADQVDSFHCLDGLTGTPVWSVPGVQHGSSGVADGVVFFGEGANRAFGKVRALSAETGEEVWSYQTGGTEIYSSPAITDGVVYIAGMDWNLYAFGTGFKYTYLDDLYAQIGSNELIVTSFYAGASVAADTISFTVTGAGINLEPSRLFGLSVSPNPFRSNASISFELSNPGLVRLDIFDLAGRSVTSLVDSEMLPGTQSLQWNGCSQSGETVSAGLYLCRIEAGGVVETVGLCLLK